MNCKSCVYWKKSMKWCVKRTDPLLDPNVAYLSCRYFQHPGPLTGPRSKTIIKGDSMSNFSPVTGPDREEGRNERKLEPRQLSD